MERQGEHAAGHQGEAPSARPDARLTTVWWLAVTALVLTTGGAALAETVVIVPEAVGLARELVSGRSVDASAQLPATASELLVGAPAAPNPDVRSRATTSELLATTSLSRTQSAGMLVYRPSATVYTQSLSAKPSTAVTTTNVIIPQRVAVPVQASPPPTTTTYNKPAPAVGAYNVNTRPNTGRPTLNPVPPNPTQAPTPAAEPAADPLATYLESMERMQIMERRRQLEVEQQGRVYDILREKVEEIGEMRAERQQRTAEKLAEMRDIRGPSQLQAINLFEGLRVDRQIELHQGQILQIDHHVYQDENPQTGLFYYAPKRYDLQWDPLQQYAMTVIYGMAGQQSSDGEVFMAARLRAGVNLAELRIAEDLLRAYLRRNHPDGSMRFRELRPLPLDSSSNVELFGGAENQFTIPPDKISVQGISGLLGSMDVSWATDIQRLLNVESLLRTDAGIHGSVVLHAAGESRFSRSIPLQIAVAEPETFGRIPFDRRGGWTNGSRYPIRLHSLHALLLSPSDGNGLRKDQPVILTWDLGDPVAAPGDKVIWQAEQVPGWVDRTAKLLWVRYSVEGDCEPCDDLVFTEKFIPPPPSTRQLVFTTGDVFESTGAHQILVHVRSQFLDPQRTRVLTRPAVVLEEDGEEVPIARLFLTDAEMNRGDAKEPFYEYKLDIVMRDGSIRESMWLESRRLDYLLGSASLRSALGEPEP